MADMNPIHSGEQQIQGSQPAEKSGLGKVFEDFLYKKVIRSLMLTSKLGRQSVLGRADAGSNFEHMYENKPEGDGPLGRLVDRVLLNLPAVKATRNRKKKIFKILRNEVQNNILLGRKTRVVDVGSGTSRYTLELRQEYSPDELEAICLDYDRESLNLGKQIAQALGADAKFIRYTRANAFRLGRIKLLSKKINWVPNVIIASGFIYYLDDETVKDALRQILVHLAPGGILIVSNVKRSLSQKLMEKVCTTGQGNAWVVHYREPGLIRQWLFEAGYQDIYIGTDPWQMYNVCTGRKSLQ